jgi:tetratricopeptide (TPR) repeat protein
VTHTALAGFVLAGAVACSRHSQPGASNGATEEPFSLTTPPTTAPSIALRNLDGEIADREKRAARGDERSQRELVPRYLSRSRFEGRVADLQAAQTMSAQILAEHPDDAAAHMLRAKALSAIHAFAAASAELDAAELKHADPMEVKAERGAILLATGREDEAVALMPITDAAPVSDLVMRAGLESRLGHAPEAERLFDLARTRYHDVSPFAVAWMDFEHARALELAGDRRRARAYLEEVAKVLPSYAHAVVHLAALEPADTALKRLEPLSATSDDPDVLAGQADALRRAGRADEAKATGVRAQARYDEVLAKLPLAYADHAASFFLGMGGDPARALALAQQNADNRPTDEALELWLTSAQAARSNDATCSASKRLLARPHASPELRDRATDASRGCP